MSECFHRAHRDASSEAHASGEALRAIRLMKIEDLLDSLHAGCCSGVARSSSNFVPVKRRRVILRYTLAIFVHLADGNLVRGFRFGGAAWIRLNEKSGQVCGGFRKLGLRRTVICGCRTFTRFVAESIKALVLTMISSAVEPSMTSLGSVHKPIKFPPLRWT